MGNRNKTNKIICFAVLLLVLSLAGTGCGDGQQVKNPVQIPSREGTETVSKAGSLNYGYFYGEDGIVVSSKERFMYSDWEPVEFDYICMDPTCSHLHENCSARTIQDESSWLKDFSLLYQDRLIILHAYFRLEINKLSEIAEEWITVIQTDVYEADPDGSNRRKKVTFSGSIDNPFVPYAAVLADGKLYFGGPMQRRERIELGDQGEWLAFEDWVSDAVYCLDLNDYTLETFATTEDKEIKEGEDGYQYEFYEYDGMIYGIISNFPGDSAVWYRIDSEAGVCEEILRFDSRAAWFGGAIGDTVYYFYMDSQETLYARELAAGTEEREIMTVTAEGMIAMPFVLDGRLLIVTDYCVEGEDRMAEYTVLDPEGKVLDRIRYDDYIIFMDVVGDKIMYIRGYPEWEVWWADKEDIKDLSEKGVRISPLNGAKLDTLED